MRLISKIAKKIRNADEKYRHFCAYTLGMDHSVVLAVIIFVLGLAIGLPLIPFIVEWFV